MFGAGDSDNAQGRLAFALNWGWRQGRRENVTPRAELTGGGVRRPCDPPVPPVVGGGAAGPEGLGRLGVEHLDHEPQRFVRPDVRRGAGWAVALLGRDAEHALAANLHA